MSEEGRPSVVFLDRDGTIIEDRHYVGDPSEVRLIPGAAGAIRRLNERHVPVVVVTNQSGIGRGLFSELDYVTVQQEVERQLAAEGARLNATYHCPHDPTRITCRCRKPGLALYERASRDLELAGMDRGVWVGDSASDVIPGVRLGGRAFLVLTGEPTEASIPPGVKRVHDLSEAVRRILDESCDAVSGTSGEPDR